MKPIAFLGDALSELRGFPESARRRAGYQLSLVQKGEDPDDWKPMGTIGPGVREIRLRDEAGIFRVLYVTKVAERVFVLHCFQKKSQKTAARNLHLAEQRYRDLLREYGR